MDEPTFKKGDTVTLRCIDDLLKDDTFVVVKNEYCSSTDSNNRKICFNSIGKYTIRINEVMARDKRIKTTIKYIRKFTEGNYYRLDCDYVSYLYPPTMFVEYFDYLTDDKYKAFRKES